MTTEQYKLRLAEIDREFELRKSQLAREYAFTNKKFKDGDVITNGIRTIRINSIKFCAGSRLELPYCVYNGENLLKSGQVSKREPVGVIYDGENVIKIN